MRAQELRRFAPRLHMRTEPERAMAVRREPMPSELEEKMVAAFERARAERLAAQIPREGAGQAVDPWTRANTAAFLTLEREHRAIAVRLSRPYWRRGDRYRDLILVTELIRLEYEHLAGRVGPPAPHDGRVGPPAPHNGSPAGDEGPADWARPWGSGPMVEIGTALIFYLDQRDRLASRLPARTLASSAADAARGRDRILSRFERAMGEWRPELENGRGAAADSGKRQAAPPIAEAAGDEERARPWASLGTRRRVAAVAAVFVAVGVGATFAKTRGGESAKVVSAPSPGVASVPEPLAARGAGSREPQSGRGDRGAQHGAAHRSRTPQRGQGNAGAREADQAALSASEIPPPAPKPAAEPAPAPTPPPPPDDGPAPEPQPDPKPQPGPISSLPPPVNGLPAPGGSGDGGG